ncbi:GGDEF domain-containing protein [Agaribacterium haliotis]|uniref:GGDEF domain-containing protein n=1 Tax=Agaribacterium haliotis TaxID=2013869 RepID=UPI000BB554AF|nr:GGDEF domain-containing protein [Agaribacterium haliotis]
MKLSIKLALYTTLIACIFAVGLTLVSYVSILERVEQNSKTSSEALVATVYNMAATAAYIEDSELAREVVEGLALNDVIDCARITTLSMALSSGVTCPGEASHTVAVYSPWDEQEEVGVLELFESRDFLKEQVSEQIYYAALILVAVIVLISAAISLITYWLVTKPIAEISQQLGRVDFGDEIHMLQQGLRKDELGVITRVINLMLANAKKQIISEQILARRTEEISKHVKLIFDLSANYLGVTDEKLRLRSCNPKFEALVRKTTGDDRSPLYSDHWLGAFSENADELKAKVLAHPDYDQPCSIEVDIPSDDDVLERRYFKFTFVKIIIEGHEASVFIYILDLTDHKRKLAKTEYEANHDNLTQLYNRLAAMRKIRHLLSAHSEEYPVAIVFIDLDGFKAINDSFGHDAGDELLKVIAARLSHSVRKTDIAARWGGDEFLIALDGVNAHQAKKIAEKILASIVKPIFMKDAQGEKCERYVGASVGVAISSAEVSDFSTLFERADKAMYMVKKSGKNAVLLFDDAK